MSELTDRIDEVEGKVEELETKIERVEDDMDDKVHCDDVPEDRGDDIDSLQEKVDDMENGIKEIRKIILDCPEIRKHQVVDKL